MPRIQRLAADLANQIAAGEVVERPASVVKELIENALDAGATRIAVVVEFGGKRLARVEDDGEGMDAEDARLSIERHATSKIARVDDLGSIVTLGFRGEALPSIASVSHFRLRTRARGTSSGTEVRVNGGVTASVREVGAPEGTLVEVTDLFYNIPARRKFLKSDGAETAQVSRVVTQFALGYPEVGFSLMSGARALLQCPAVSSLADRLFQLYGERRDLVEVRKQAGGIRLAGYVAALSEQGPVRGPQNLFVNRRIVKDRTISHAISEAYAAATIKERSPEAHLFLEVPPGRVDVNVHPTKAEVRFLEPSLVHEVVRRAIGDALGQGRAPELSLQPVDTPAAQPQVQALPGVVAGLGVAVEETSPAGASTAPVPTLRPMIPLGQFRDTFIVAVDDEGIAIVDQHVAHERVLFEQVMERLTTGRPESQRLLVPLVLSLSAVQREVLRVHASALEQLGFGLEEFGGESLRISATPAMLDHREAEGAVRALAEDLEGLGRGVPVEEILRRIAATTACHAAVKANDRLTPEKMVYILEELRRTAYSTVCPHGRPVVLRITRREIERNFQRI